MKNGITKKGARAAHGTNARFQEELQRVAMAKKVKATEQRRLDKLRDELKARCWKCWTAGGSACTCPEKQLRTFFEKR